MEMASIRKIYIYTLSSPITHKVRYVGKAINPLKRLTQHMIDARNNKFTSYKDNWLRKLIKNNLLPELHVIDEIESLDWEWLEQYWIAQFKAWGFKLVNMTDGGDGNKNQIMTPETRLKISFALKGKLRPEEIKKKISEGHKYKVLTIETKEKLRKVNLGKIRTEESKNILRKKVYCFKDNIKVKTFDSVLEASIYFKCRKGAISNAISRETKSFRSKYKLSYKDIVGQ